MCAWTLDQASKPDPEIPKHALGLAEGTSYGDYGRISTGRRCIVPLAGVPPAFLTHERKCHVRHLHCRATTVLARIIHGPHVSASGAGS